MRRLIGFASLLLVVCISIVTQRELTDKESSLTSAEPALIRSASLQESSHLVLVRGQGKCSGTPIVGTLYVVTAAHCVLDKYTGKFTSKYDVRVEYNDTRYDVSGVLALETEPPVKGKVFSKTDIAVLILTEPILGIGVNLGSYEYISEGGTLVGYQPVVSKDAFYHPASYDELSSFGSMAPVIPAACTFTSSQAWRVEGVWSVSCGMVPGGSGGPVLAVKNGEILLVGVISSVNSSLSANGIASAALVAEMLRNPDNYYYSLTNVQEYTPGLYR